MLKQKVWMVIYLFIWFNNVMHSGGSRLGLDTVYLLPSSGGWTKPRLLSVHLVSPGWGGGRVGAEASHFTRGVHC